MASLDAKTFGRKVQAMGDRLFVRIMQNQKNYGSIIIPESHKEKLDLLVSEVLSVGPKVGRHWRASKALVDKMRVAQDDRAVFAAVDAYEAAINEDPMIRSGDYVLHVRTCLLRYDGILGRVGASSRDDRLNVSSEFGFIFEKDIIAVVDPTAVVSGKDQYDGGEQGMWSQNK